MNLQWVDFAIVAIILFSTIISLARGFLREFISLLTWIVAIWLAFRFNTQLAALLTHYIKNTILRTLAGFGGLFVGTLILGGITNFFISVMVVRTGLSGTDRSIGMVFGLVRGVLLISVLLLLAVSFNCAQSTWWQQSLLVTYFQAPVTWLREFLPQKLFKIVNSQSGAFVDGSTTELTTSSSVANGTTV